MKERYLCPPTILSIVGLLALQAPQIEADMKAPEVEEHLKETMRLSREFGIEGTPAFVIGDELVPDAASFDQLQALVAKARDDQ